MTYVPNPDDATHPTLADPALSAAEEFRLLKAKVNTVAASITGTKGTRQTVLDGPTTAGLPSCCALSATALGVDLKATATPVTLTFATGFSSGGNSDIVQRVTANVVNFWPSLAISNLTYLGVDRTPTGDPTPGKFLARPQYGLSYEQKDASILQFGGAAASTTFLDDFGNTWTAQGGAIVQNTQFKFGSGGLGGGGAAAALDGSTDYVKSTAFSTKVWKDGWAIRGWFYCTALPGVGVIYDVASFLNAGGFGAELVMYNNAGTIKFGYNLSSNGSSNNIAALAVGSTTPSLNTWYYLELTFDKLAGVYRLYVAGVQEQSTTSSAVICATTLASVGAKATGANFCKGYIDKFEMLNYCQHPAGTTYSVPVAAPAIATAGYASDFFSLFDYVMYSVTAASASAAANPTLTPVSRLYMGEAETNGAAVTLVRPYAYQGLYEGVFATIPAASTVISASHNIGTERLKNKRVIFQCLTTDNGYLPGQQVEFMMNSSALFVLPSMQNNHKLIGFTFGNTSNAPRGQSAVDGSLVALTATSWQYKISCERGF